jgi:hypothetical protein
MQQQALRDLEDGDRDHEAPILIWFGAAARAGCAPLNVSTRIVRPPATTEFDARAKRTNARERSPGAGTLEVRRRGRAAMNGG